MLTRTLRMRGLARAVPRVSRATYSSSGADTVAQVPANDPKQRADTQNVSDTNSVATSSEGNMDMTLQESVAEAEQMRTMQAPNRKGTWSTSQQLREVAMSGPRFEQTMMSDQVRHSGFTWRHPWGWIGKKRKSLSGRSRRYG